MYRSPLTRTTNRVSEIHYFGSYRKIPSPSPTHPYYDLAWAHSLHQSHKLKETLTCTVCFFFAFCLYTLNNLQYLCKLTFYGKLLGGRQSGRLQLIVLGQVLDSA